MTRHVTITTGGITALLFALACGAGSRPPAPAADRSYYEAPTPAANEPPASNEQTDQGNLNVAADIRQLCGIDDPAPYFAYNSAHLRGGDHPLLAKLIACFTAGPLKEKNFLFVGHCDPRGEHEYNILLGERRAASVKRFFTTRGLHPVRIATSSRGNMDATGKDAASWAVDRRVDIRIGN
jgi:peptidoglycan-associated lipoprotein